jgi:hypothetical protein
VSARRSPAEPMPLEEVQRFMEGALQRPAPLASDSELVAMTERCITGNRRLSPVEQLEIYREQFWLRHKGALREDFPTLLHLLGDDAFDALAEAYLLAHPPASFTLRDLGDRLAAFVETTPPWKDDPILGEAARLEWAFVEAFDAPDSPALDPSALTGAREEAWANARVEFQPALRRLSLTYPVDELRGKIRAGEPVSQSPPRSSTPRRHVVIYRAGLGHAGSTADLGTLQYIEVEPMAFELLEALAKGMPLGPACESVADAAGVDDPSALEARIGALFQQWAAFGWMSRVIFA